MQLKDTVFYVTGGASGLGAATVRALHARGALIGLWDLDVAGGEALAKELDGAAAGSGSGRIVVSEVDVCEEEDVVNAIAACDKQWPKNTVGGCVNCGGVGMAGKVSARIWGGRLPDPARLCGLLCCYGVGAYL